MRRKKISRLRDEPIIQEMHLKGKYQQEIADYLNEQFDGEVGYPVSQKTISNDLKKILKKLAKQVDKDLTKIIGVELAKINLVEATAWDGWESSVEDEQMKQSKATKRNKDKSNYDDQEDDRTDIPDIIEQTVTSKTKNGNSAFLSIILKAGGDRRKLLGLDKPEKIDLTSGGKKLSGNVIALPDNGRMIPTSEEDKKLLEGLINNDSDESNKV